jgi:hypothetical protein
LVLFLFNFRNNWQPPLSVKAAFPHLNKKEGKIRAEIFFPPKK